MPGLMQKKATPVGMTGVAMLSIDEGYRFLNVMPEMSL
jgi:hypothetical protein